MYRFDCCRLYNSKSKENKHVVLNSMLPSINETLFDGEEQITNHNLSSIENENDKQHLVERLIYIRFQLQVLDQQRATCWIRRTLMYPFAMLALFLLSTTTALLAFQNTMELLIGIKALPLITKVSTMCLYNQF